MAKQNAANACAPLAPSEAGPLTRLRWKLAPALRWYIRYAPGTIAKSLLAPPVDFVLQAQPRDFVTKTVFGAELSGTTEDWIHRYLFVFGVWEPNLTAWITERLEPGDVFVDVGANIGYYSLLAANCVGEDGRVVAIEASPSVFLSLTRNLARNNAQAKVRSVNVAAAETPSRLTVYRGREGNLGATTTVASEELRPEAEIDSLPLAEILAPAEIARARLIKIDVEGFEGPVVRGLLPALDLFRDDLEIMLEVNGSSRPPGETSAEIVDSLRDCGFHLYRIPNIYSPEAYVEAQAARQRPRRLDGEIDEEELADLVFSRVDAVAL